MITIYTTHLWLIGGILLLLMLAAAEAGFRLGRRAESRTAEKTKSQISVIAGSVLGVLGLLLGFTMSMAVTRYETRKQLILEEANAIGTSWLRTRLLPEPEASDIAALLREYVDMRVYYVGSAGDMDALTSGRAHSARLQTDFWTRAVAYAQKNPNPVLAGLLLQSLNQVIDLDAARWMAFQNRVPEPVIYINAFVALLSATLVGYAVGMVGGRQLFSVCLLCIAITAVIVVVIDLDRPRQGLIHVTQQPLIDLQRQLQVSSR